MVRISVLLEAVLALAGAGITSAAPWSVPQEHYEVLALRHATPLNPDSVTDVHCRDKQAHILSFHENAAQLAICDGIAGARTRCGGSPATTVGTKGSASFTLAAANDGATINISKVRWEECVHAARVICPTGSLSGTCLGGATLGDVTFTLESPPAR